jgi:hypothetical protein
VPQISYNALIIPVAPFIAIKPIDLFVHGVLDA